MAPFRVVCCAALLGFRWVAAQEVPVATEGVKISLYSSSNAMMSVEDAAAASAETSVIADRGANTGTVSPVEGVAEEVMNTVAGEIGTNSETEGNIETGADSEIETSDALVDSNEFSRSAAVEHPETAVSVLESLSNYLRQAGYGGESHTSGAIAPGVTVVPQDEPSNGNDSSVYYPVSNLDLARFAGTWYEQALSMLPAETFQKGCECTSGKYQLVEKEKKNVRGRHGRDEDRPEIYLKFEHGCVRHKQRKRKSIDGYLVPVTPFVSSNPQTVGEGRLDMQQNRRPRIPEVGNLGQYWVVAIGEQDNEGPYDTAVVGGPSRYAPVWFMTRERIVPDTKIEEMKSAAMAAGLPASALSVENLVRTVQYEECNELD